MQRASERIVTAIGFGGVLGVLLSLFAFVVLLEAVGPPPRWRIDALWVWGHTRAVRMMMAALAAAITITALLFVFRGGRYGRRRIVIVLMWIAAAFACTALYWDRLPVLYDVVAKRVWR